MKFYLVVLFFIFIISPFASGQTLQDGDRLRDTGEAFKSQNKPDMALKNYLEAIQVYEKVQARKRLVETNTAIGMLFQEVGIYDKAIAYYTDAQGFLTSQDTVQQTQLLGHLAYAYLQKGGSYLQNSLDSYLQLLQTALQKKDHNAEMHVRHQIALVYQKKEDWDNMLLQKKMLLTLAEENNRPEEIALAKNNLAYAYRKVAYQESGRDNHQASLDTLKKSLQLLDEALKISPDQPEIKESRLITLLNMGVIYQNLDNYRKSLPLFKRVLKERIQEENSLEIARTYNMLAKTYYFQRDYIRTESNAKKAIGFAKKSSIPPFKRALKNSYEILSLIYEKFSDYKTLSRYKDSLYQTTLDLEHFANEQLKTQSLLKEVEQNELTDIAERDNRRLDSIRVQKEKQLIQERLRRDATLRELAEAKAREAQKAKALAQSQAAQALQAREIALIQAKKAEREKQLAMERARRDSTSRELALAQAREAKQAQRLATAEAQQAIQAQKQAEERERRKEQVYLLIYIFGFFGLVFLFILISYFRNRRKNKLLKERNTQIQEQNLALAQSKEEIEAQRDAIEQEREKADELLLNILPYETSKELKEKGSATPKSYKMVSVLFTDFKGFTKIAAKLSPEEVIQELDRCFKAFDDIVEKYHLEKIKTIGDAYMCAGGIPTVNHTNPTDAVKAGLEMQRFMEKMHEEKAVKGEDFWEVRIGVHTGPLVAGVVGRKKFAYDIWGDAVNTASRMESSGEPGKVNISGETHALVQEHFICTYRGKIPAKNKGEIDMYFVEGEKR